MARNKRIRRKGLPEKKAPMEKYTPDGIGFLQNNGHARERGLNEIGKSHR